MVHGRPLVQPSDMFGEFRSILHYPTTHHWQRLVELVEQCDPQIFSTTLMPYMLALLETSRWQRITRTVPKRWLRDLSEGAPAPWIRLCNTLKIQFKPKPYNRIFRALRLQPWLLDGLQSFHLSGDLSDAHLAMIPVINARFQLHTLRIDSQSVNDEALAQLLAQPIMHGLRTLICKGATIGPHSVSVLAEAPHLQGITCLVMRGTSLTPVQFERLLKSPASHQWRQLDISSRQPGWASLLPYHELTQHNHLHDEGIALLTRATHIRKLEALHLTHSHLTHVGLTHLRRATHLRSLTHINMSHSHGLTDLAVDVLLHSPVLQNIESLDLSHCSLSNEGIALLNTSQHLPHLKELNVTGNLSEITHRIMG